MTIPARYENGVFRPLQNAPIKEGTVVEVHVPVEVPAKRPRSIGDLPCHPKTLPAIIEDSPDKGRRGVLKREEDAA